MFVWHLSRDAHQKFGCMHLQLKETTGQEALTIYATTNSKTDLKYFFLICNMGTSLVVQWLRICFAMPGMQV